ncbi:YceI family protein [Actinobacteria bacterium YIM 96077]|uniref:Polyisoprenoid-binding protein n=1 Tax=Phytoactinopolyspora halophila TaxID=1981511 RepID=A0A329QSM7_9ACTN|nr:YceI family protein [Phytoactinopolyspora halophila]AYY14927.1 YceI family protein [Actinobacteria bacterium YIM 96077]RAW15384.1 polyisoprenoid-binding protein [Phytoactinopolyspora halophila]
MLEPVGVRTWNGISLPTPGTFTIDAAHTTVGFVARHLMVTQVRGRFEQVEGRIDVADDPLRSRASAVISTASIVTGADDRDAHLRSADFLDVDLFPTMTFTSREIVADSDAKWAMVDGRLVRRRRGAGRFTVIGDLTIKSITRPVTLHLTIDGVTPDPWGGERLALSANGEIDREDYDMTWNVALEAGGWLVSQKIQIEIRAQAVRTS